MDTSSIPATGANDSSNPEEETKRELLIGLPVPHNKDDDNNESSTLQQQPHGYVNITPTSTLANVRESILQEFDDDVLPTGGFNFVLNGNCLVMAKQEGRHKVWDLAAPAANNNNDHQQIVRVELRAKAAALSPVVKKKRTSDEALPMPAVNVKRARSQQENLNHDDATHAKSGASHDDDEPTANHEIFSRKAFLKDDETNDNNKISERNLKVVTTDKNPTETHRSPGKETTNADQVIIQDDSDSDTDTDDDFLLLDSGDNDERVSANIKKLMSKRQHDDGSLLRYDNDYDDLLEPPDYNTENSKKSSDSNMELNVESNQGNADNTASEVAVISESNDPHRIHNQALKDSSSVLEDLNSLLQQNPLFCSNDRRTQFADEIKLNLQKLAPDTVVGVLGSTGVGKSSLLNALLDEASVLPTSGSRGCTAAVVELRYNKQLLDEPTTTPVPVYKGTVDFITLQEWQTELNILLQECSTLDSKTIYVRPPESDRQPDAAAAWSKINQVYGQGTMERYHGNDQGSVYRILSTNRRVVDLLTPDGNDAKAYKSIVVQEGEVDKAQAGVLLREFANIPARMRRTKKKWAASFRSKINSYVYRSGNELAPQTWPLIRKVVLQGPWTVLSTGACLVDLPGVRDANAARAKVSETYLQNCNQIWVVAPIKRAVDDGTAKELLGEQFKRRLLMDGQYGNVSFICTQTDDCEPTEIMRDHQDVAMKEPGRWEKMKTIRDELAEIEKILLDLESKGEELKMTFDEAKEETIQCQKELLEAEKEADDEQDGEEPEDVQVLEQLKRVAKEARANAKKAWQQLESWKSENAEKMQQMKRDIRIKQRLLKSICAAVRNEYSKACLQEDFRAGLEELYQNADDDGDNDNGNNPSKRAVPDNFEMDVYCISSNDYLKLTGIKPSSDGPPNTFLEAGATQIPSLRSFVHQTTTKARALHTEAFVNAVSDLVDRIKLLATDTCGVSGGRAGRRCQAIFEEEMRKLEDGVAKEAKQFQLVATRKIESSLQPALKSGAGKGRDAAMSTVRSWGSKSRRSRAERSPDQNGLHYATYLATVRRDGAYVSCTAGVIDLNSELCEPMEKEFGNKWQETMDASFRTFLAEYEQRIFSLCSKVDQALVSAFAATGMDVARLRTIATTANRTYTTAVKAAFGAMRTFATDTQRELNRSLLPLVQARMKQGYFQTVNVAGGTGKFNRMKMAIENHSNGAVMTMFDESINQLCSEISKMIDRLSTMVNQVTVTIRNCLEGVYSICWNDQSDKSALVDPTMQTKIRECRDNLLPDLNRLRSAQDDTMKLVGIDREALELEVMTVESLETRIEKSFQKSQEAGEVIDLCDSSDEDDNDVKPAASASTLPPVARKIKAEPEGRSKSSPRCRTM